MKESDSKYLLSFAKQFTETNSPAYVLTKHGGIERIEQHREFANLFNEREDIVNELKTLIPLERSIRFNEVVEFFKRTGKSGSYSPSNFKENAEYLVAVLEELNTNESKRPKSTVKIFYSWQSDLPNRTNRRFIQDCLKKVSVKLKQEFSCELKIDSDTRDVPGSPDIVNTILEKIRDTDLFLADVSIVLSNNRKSFPNSNVMFELGYALSELKSDKILMVFNEAFGPTNVLPFDLGFKRQLTYCLKEDENKEEAKRILIGKIYDQIKLSVR